MILEYSEMYLIYLIHIKYNLFTIATSFWLSTLKCAVPTKYNFPPSGVVSNVTVSGNFSSMLASYSG